MVLGDAKIVVAAWTPIKWGIHVKTLPLLLQHGRVARAEEHQTFVVASALNAQVRIFDLDLVARSVIGAWNDLKLCISLVGPAVLQPELVVEVAIGYACFVVVAAILRSKLGHGNGVASYTLETEMTLCRLYRKRN